MNLEKTNYVFSAEKCAEDINSLCSQNDAMCGEDLPVIDENSWAWDINGCPVFKRFNRQLEVHEYMCIVNEVIYLIDLDWCVREE